MTTSIELARKIANSGKKDGMPPADIVRKLAAAYIELYEKQEGKKDALP
jgi:hypothetical protein